VLVAHRPSDTPSIPVRVSTDPNCNPVPRRLSTLTHWGYDDTVITQGQVAAKSKDLTRVVTKLFGVDAGKRGISLEQFRTLVTRVQDLVRDMQIRVCAVGLGGTAIMA